MAAWLGINGITELVTSMLRSFFLLLEEVMDILMNATKCYDTADIQDCTVKPKQRV
jgi:hypothetical protein